MTVIGHLDIALAAFFGLVLIASGAFPPNDGSRDPLAAFIGGVLVVAAGIGWALAFS